MRDFIYNATGTEWAALGTLFGMLAVVAALFWFVDLAALKLAAQGFLAWALLAPLI